MIGFYNDLLEKMKEVSDKLSTQRELEVKVESLKRQLESAEQSLNKAKVEYSEINDHVKMRTNLAISAQNDCVKLAKGCLDFGKSLVGDQYKAPDRYGVELKKKFEEIRKQMQQHRFLTLKYNVMRSKDKNCLPKDNPIGQITYEKCNKIVPYGPTSRSTAFNLSELEKTDKLDGSNSNDESLTNPFFVLLDEITREIIFDILADTYDAGLQDDGPASQVSLAEYKSPLTDSVKHGR